MPLLLPRPSLAATRPTPTRDILISAALGLLTFLYRLLSHRGLHNDHFMQLAWSQQLLTGQLPVRDFVDPGMPLTYALSAVVQAVVPGPFSEAVLACLMVGVAAAATSLVIARTTGSLAWAVAGTLLAVALEPRLYGYPKVLAPAGALAWLWWYTRKPVPARATVLGAWTAACALWRYDLGVYVAAAVATGLVVCDGRRAWRSIAACAAGGTAAIGPWLLMVALTYGLPAHLAESREFLVGDSHQLAVVWPAFPAFTTGAPLGQADAVAWLVYLSYVLPLAIALSLVVGRREIERPQAAMAAATAVLLAAYCVVVLRHPMDARIRDLAAPLSIAAAWVGARALRTMTPVRGLSVAAMSARSAGAGLVLAVIVTTAGAGWRLGDVVARLDEARLLENAEKVLANLETFASAGTVWPWTRYWPAGELPDVVPYVAACTTPRARLLVTWNAPEIYFFARRPFGAGHAYFLPPHGFTRSTDRQRMVERLIAHPPVIALINESEWSAFADAYPEVAQYLDASFSRVDRYELRDGSIVAIAVRNGLAAASTYGPQDWPCDFSDAPQTTTSAPTTAGQPTPGYERRGRFARPL